MENYNEKEFSIGDLIKLEISRNDFEDLGSVLVLNYSHLISTNHVITMSFYDNEYLQISQKNLLLLCNYENVLFDNVLLITSLGKTIQQNSSYTIKLLNKEITYMKLFVQAATFTSSISNKKGTSNKDKDQGSDYSFSQLFDVKSLCALDLKESAQLFKQGNNTLNVSDTKNANLTLILSEIENINQSLIAEKEQIEISKKDLKEKEDRIIDEHNHFKGKMLLFANKRSGEFYNEISVKMADLQKKMNSLDMNVTNKIRLIKEKYKSESVLTNSNIITNDKNTKTNKEKIANLEIKISFLEDSNNTLKQKLQEKENEIKSNYLNEEKQSKIIKKLKDEIVLQQIQLKDKKEKEKTSNIPPTSVIINKTTTSQQKIMKPKKLISLEINKLQLEQYNSLLILSELISNNISINTPSYMVTISDKEIQIISLLLMNLIINPINIYTKFPFCHVLIIHKLLPSIFLNQNSLFQFEECLNDYALKFPEFKSILTSSTNSSITNDQISLINISTNVNKIEINCNDILLIKSKSFNSFLMKNKGKYIEKKNTAMYRYILLSNYFFLLILSNDITEIYSIIEDIYKEFLVTKDHCAIVYLLKKKYIELIILIIAKSVDIKDCTLIFEILIDTILSIISQGYPILSETVIKELLKPSIKPLIKKTIINSEYCDKIIILLTMISIDNVSMRFQLKDFEKEIESLTKSKNNDCTNIIKSNISLLLINIKYS